MPEDGSFGVELRRLRVRANLSLGELARRLYYSKGYLSKIESGDRPPTAKLARMADAELNAGGALASLVPSVSPVSSYDQRDALPPTGPDPEPRWADRVTGFGEVMSLPLALSPSDASLIQQSDLAEAYFREQFDRCRRLGQSLAPALVLRSLVMELGTLLELADAELRTSGRRRMTLLAARYAEYAGWMAQEAGHREAALAWTHRFALLADRVDTPGLAAYALVREAELAMYAQDAAMTVALAEQAARHPASTARTQGLAAHREAQGHALLGDHGRCMAALDRAEELLSKPDPAEDDLPVLGSSTVVGLGEAVAGWCHYDLGRPRQATRFLEGALGRTPPDARRARALYGARLTLAYEAAGELDQAINVGERVLADVDSVSSASAYGELRVLSRALVRRQGHRPARELHTEINAVLQRAPRPPGKAPRLPGEAPRLPGEAPRLPAREVWGA